MCWKEIGLCVHNLLIIIDTTSNINEVVGGDLYDRCSTSYPGHTGPTSWGLSKGVWVHVPFGLDGRPRPRRALHRPGWLAWYGLTFKYSSL